MARLSSLFSLGAVALTLFAAYGCSEDPPKAPPPVEEEEETPPPTPRPPPTPPPTVQPPAPPPTPVSNPGMITCGGNACTVDTQICCWPDNDKAKAACLPQCGSGVAFEVKCDEPADCGAGNGKCCVKFGNASCGDDDCSPFGGIELCKTDADCGEGVKCNDKICKRGPQGSQVSLALRVCGTPADCP